MDGVVISYQLKADAVDAFLEASLENARLSLADAGTLRFDLLQDAKDPAKIVLIELYASEAARAAHLASAHFQAWREATRDLHAAPPVLARGPFLVGRGLEVQS